MLALVVTFKCSNPALILSYAAVEGVFIGGISKLFETQYSGIVLHAAVGTALCFGTVLVLYTQGLVKATPRFTKMILVSMVGIYRTAPAVSVQTRACEHRPRPTFAALVRGMAHRGPPG